jgi:hypothetical protein
VLEYSLFNQLPVWSQVEVLKKKGNAVAQRQYKDWTISLYSLDNYFVELWVKPSLEIIGAFHRSVKPMAILEPYMEYLEIPN